MDGMSRVLDETLLRDLECPVCLEYMVPPITLCNNGHDICSTCREKVEECPTCSGKFSGIRNVALEKIARRLQYPCTNRDRGCTLTFPIDLLYDHQVICKHGQIQCPINKVQVACPWKGKLSDLKEHVRDAHREYFSDTADFNARTVAEAAASIIFCFGGVFLYYKRIKNGRFYCVIQLIGSHAEASKYKSEFKLRAENGIDQITETFIVRSFMEDFETSFSSGKCLRLDDEVIRNFVTHGKLNLTITISAV
jgi:E3 ubiquitin-protein ligase SIAH1